MRTKTLLPRIRSSIARTGAVRMRTARVAVVSVATAAIVTASIAALGGQAPAYAAPEAASPVTPACAWYELSVSTDNESAPDSAATYWLLPYTVQDGLRIVLNGRYPDSRYSSLQAYKSTGGLFSTNGVESALTDYRIEPDPGSVNPWQHTARHPGQGGDAFTVTLRSDVAPGQVNTLPLAPASTAPGTAGYLIYRVYLPARGDFSRVPLPVVTFTLGGVSKQVPACPPSTAPGGRTGDKRTRQRLIRVVGAERGVRPRGAIGRRLPERGLRLPHRRGHAPRRWRCSGHPGQGADRGPRKSPLAVAGTRHRHAVLVAMQLSGYRGGSAGG
ncbi:MAG: hypothetical protein ABSA93_03405 [Streptosporangiaceae bacterium]